MTFPLTERQADQMTAEALRQDNLDRANNPLHTIEPKWNPQSADILRGLYGVRDALAAKPTYQRMLEDLNAQKGRLFHPGYLTGSDREDWLRDAANTYAVADAATQQYLYEGVRREWLAAGLGQ